LLLEVFIVEQFVEPHHSLCAYSSLLLLLPLLVVDYSNGCYRALHCTAVVITPSRVTDG